MTKWSGKGWGPFRGSRASNRWQTREGSAGGAPPPPFDPSSIANMVYWFDPSDPATITLGGSGDVNVLADKLGNWVMYAGGVASRQPVLEAINGVTALRYHAWPDSDYLKLADVPLS